VPQFLPAITTKASATPSAGAHHPMIDGEVLPERAAGERAKSGNLPWHVILVY